MRDEVIDLVLGQFDSELGEKILTYLPKNVTLEEVDDYIDDTMIILMEEEEEYNPDRYEDSLPAGYSKALKGDGIRAYTRGYYT